MRHWKHLVLAGALVLTACSDGDENGEPTSSTVAGEEAAGGWTIMQYAIADNDLEPYMMEDIEEMAGVEPSEHLSMVALVDRHPGYLEGEVAGLADWTGTKLLEVGGGGVEEIEDLGEANLGSPDTLAAFIERSVGDYPNDNYALVISNHGGGPSGLGPDESSDADVLTVAELDAGLKDGLEAAGLDRLDMIGFDACLMASYEVASTVAGYADRMIASEELEPGHGWDYGSLALLSEAPATSDELGRALLEGYEAQADEEGTLADTTLSLLDLTKIPALDDAVEALSAELAEQAGELGPVVGRNAEETLAFAKSPDPSSSANQSDLGMLAAAIGAEAPDISEEADAVVEALDAAVVDSVAGPINAAATGLAIHFPPAAEYVNEDYVDIDAAEHWTDFLRAYYAAGEAIPESEQPAVVEEEGGPEIEFDDDGVNMFAAIDPSHVGDIVDTTISYGVAAEDGSVTYLGEETAFIDEDGSISGSYDLTILEMSDGEDTAVAYITLDQEEDADVFTIDVPLAYYEPEETEEYTDVSLLLTVDGQTGDVLDETYYVYNDGADTWGEFTADPEGTIVPEVLTVAPDGTASWVPTHDVGLWADLPEIQYDFVALDPGTPLHLELAVYDFGGNVDTVAVQVPVPA